MGPITLWAPLLGPVFLRGAAVALHPLELDDAPFIAGVINDPEVRRSLATDRPLSDRDERAWIENLDDHNPEGVDLLVCADGDPVGTIGITDVAQRWGTGEVGFMIARDAWNFGYVTDAVDTLAVYAFGEFAVRKPIWRQFVTNPASARVLEKA